MSLVFRTLVAFAVVASLSGVTTPAPAAAKAKPMMCPVCKTMPLSATKTKASPQMVKVHGKTMYCCAKCPMGKGGHMKMEHGK